MNYLNPDKVRIGGRRYRKLYFASENQGKLPGSSHWNHNGGSEDIASSTYWEDEQCDAEETDAPCEMQRTTNGYVMYCSDVPSYYFKFICGKKNETRARIEKETKTQLKIPRPGQEGDIVIQGQERGGVLSAKSRIELIVESAKRRCRPTHFISIPLVCDSTKARFVAFKDLVLQECSKCHGFDEEIIQIPEKLHLTMGVMALMNEKEIARAAMVLRSIQDEIISNFINGKPLKIILEGVACMNDDPSEVVVLYAKVKLDDRTDRLQGMADFIVEKFVANGLMKREYDKVKLHATIMNTRFKNIDDDNQQKSWHKKPRSPRGANVFDARKVFELCHDFKFGEVDVDAIHLSKRGEYGPDGFYICESSIQL